METTFSKTTTQVLAGGLPGVYVDIIPVYDRQLTSFAVHLYSPFPCSPLLCERIFRLVEDKKLPIISPRCQYPATDAVRP